MVHIAMLVLVLDFIGTRCDQFNSNHRRNLQQTDELQVFTVELLIVADFSIFEFFYARQEKQNRTERIHSTQLDIRKHYQTVVNGVNRRFSTITNTSMVIRLTLTDLITLKDRQTAIWVDSYDKPTLEATGTLSYFRKWLRLSHHLPDHDHAMLFTRYDLTKDGSNTLAGLAYVQSMCTSTSMSVVEDDMSSQVNTVVAHELAHSLGASHDGGTNRCSSLDNFIMSETTSITDNLARNRNSWLFSACSIEYFQLYISRLNDEGNNCLRKHSQQDETSLEDGNSTYTVSEAVSSPDEQCRIIQGNNSYLCRNMYTNGYGELCALMYCSVDDTSCAFRLPMDGTACGKDMICKSGYCVFHDNLESGNITGQLKETCLFGDQPGLIGSSSLDCAKVVLSQPFLCYHEDYSSRCCPSCASKHTGINGCEYGDKKAACSSVTRIECLFNDNDCCATCAHYAATMSELVLPVSLGGGGLLLLIMLVVVAVSVRKCKRRCRENSPGAGGHALEADLNRSRMAEERNQSRLSQTMTSPNLGIPILASNQTLSYPLYNVQYRPQLPRALMTGPEYSGNQRLSQLPRVLMMGPEYSGNQRLPQLPRALMMGSEYNGNQRLSHLSEAIMMGPEHNGQHMLPYLPRELIMGPGIWKNSQNVDTLNLNQTSVLQNAMKQEIPD